MTVRLRCDLRVVAGCLGWGQLGIGFIRYSCSSERGRGVTLALRFCLRRVYERIELRDFSLFLTVAGVHLGPSLRLRVQRVRAALGEDGWDLDS